MKLTGIMPALLTPFGKDGSVNYAMLREMIEFHIANGCTGEYVCGSTGEGFLLTEAERRKVTETSIQQARGRIPIIVHVGALTTAEACRLAVHAKEAGAQAISSVPPFYYSVGAEGIKQHYAEIAKACDLPMYIYNIPGTTGVTVTPAMVRDICERIPTVVGIKFSSYDFFQMQQIIAMEIKGKQLNVLSGPDEMMVAAQALGADGAIGTTYNILPRLFSDAYNAFQAGDVKKASELQGKANKVIAAFLSYPGISATKEIMRLIGFDCGSGRLPQPPLSEAAKAELKGRLDAIGFFSLAVTR